MSSCTKCQICGAECQLTKHHLVPQVKCKNKYKAVKNDDSNIIWICRPCHDTVHASFSESELKYFYNTLDALLASEPIQRWKKWRVSHYDFTGSAAMSNRRKKK